MTKHNVTITVPILVGNRTVGVSCVVSRSASASPVLLWAEIGSVPVDVEIWDAIEAELASPGPIADLYQMAYDRAAVPYVAA